MVHGMETKWLLIFLGVFFDEILKHKRHMKYDYG